MGEIESEFLNYLVESEELKSLPLTIQLMKRISLSDSDEVMALVRSDFHNTNVMHAKNVYKPISTIHNE